MCPPDRVWRLELGGVNAYLVDDGDHGLTLVDAGTPWDSSRIRDHLRAVGHSVEDVERVLVTHFDLDHVGTLSSLDCDPTVYIADPDADYLSGDRSPPLSNHKGVFQRLGQEYLTLPDLDVERVVDGDRIGGFTAVHTPGHTPGHTTFLHEEYGVAFVGDLVRGRNGELQRSPPIRSYDPDEADASIRSLIGRLPPVEIVAMGHGEPYHGDGVDALRRLAEAPRL